MDGKELPAQLVGEEAGEGVAGALLAEDARGLQTDRQLAVLSSRGLPLLGDGKYGGGSGQIALWSAALSFPHPSDGREMAFHALPQGGAWDQFGETLLSLDFLPWSP